MRLRRASLGQDGALDLLLEFVPSPLHCVCAESQRSLSRLARAQPDARASLPLAACHDHHVGGSAICACDLETMELVTDVSVFGASSPTLSAFRDSALLGV